MESDEKGLGFAGEIPKDYGNFCKLILKGH